MKDELIGGAVGTSVSIVGTASQTNQYLQTISLVITIIGGLITIWCTGVMPIINWYKKAKSDGHISKEELEECKPLVLKVIDMIKKLFKKKKDDE